MPHASIEKAALKKSSFPSLALIAAFFIATGAGRAHAACIVPPADMPLEQQLLSLQDCQRNAEYLAQVGHLFNARGRYLDALDHLERALMFQPNLAPAQFDYAIALAGTGDLLSARQLLDSLIAQPDLPAPLRQVVIDARQRFARYDNPALPVAETKGQFGLFTLSLSANVRLGQDNNLLGAPNLSSLELTFPGEVVVLQLTGSNAPRAGTYTRSDAKAELTRQNLDGSRWEAAASLMQRTSVAVPEANTRQSEFMLEYSLPALNSWGGYVSTSFVNLNTEGGTHYSSQGVAAGVQLSALAAALRSTCSARAGIEWQNRDLGSNPILSGRYLGVNALWACSPASGGQWQLSGKIGLDRPQDATRPGGDQSLASLRGAAIWPVTSLLSWQGAEGKRVQSIGTLLIDAELSFARDTTGYSALLDNNAVRSTARLTTRLEFQRPFSAGMLGTLGTEWSSQASNLPLFRVKSWGPYAALRVLW